MEGKVGEKDTIEDIENAKTGTIISPRRPRNFSLQRRTEVFYFSDDSARGILKRILIKNGNYKLNEPKTVSEKSDTTKAGYEPWTNIPLRSIENSQAMKNDDFVSDLTINDQNKNTMLKSRDKTAEYKPRLHGWSDITGSKWYKKHLKPIGEPMQVNKLDKNKYIFPKLFEGIKKDEEEANTLGEAYSPRFRRSKSVNYKKISTFSQASSSQKKTSGSHDCLNKTWPEESLSEALSQMETPTEEF